MANYKEITLTAASPTADISNPAGSVEIGGTFNGATVTVTLQGGTTAVETYTAADTFFCHGSHMTFTASGGGGSESIWVRWYFDSNVPLISQFDAT
jgi:hypothetical protein